MVMFFACEQGRISYTSYNVYDLLHISYIFCVNICILYTGVHMHRSVWRISRHNTSSRVISILRHNKSIPAKSWDILNLPLANLSLAT